MQGTNKHFGDCDVLLAMWTKLEILLYKIFPMLPWPVFLCFLYKENDDAKNMEGIV